MKNLDSPEVVEAVANALVAERLGSITWARIIAQAAITAMREALHDSIIAAYTGGFQECMGEFDIDTGDYDENDDLWSANIPGYAEQCAKNMGFIKGDEPK